MDEFIKIWILGHSLKALIILISAYVLIFIIKHLFSVKLINLLAEIKHKNPKEEAKIEGRLRTIRSVVINLLKTIVYLIAFIMILAEFQVNVGPILAGAGIMGLAIGFGARKLIEDYISGLFILIENQYSKGDDVEFLGQNVKGKVYGFNLRRTIIKTQEGALIFIPNGQILKVINYSRN